jgi:hypothetical protein
MILVARIGSIEMMLDDEQPGIHCTPEQIEDISHRSEGRRSRSTTCSRTPSRPRLTASEPARQRVPRLQA